MVQKIHPRGVIWVPSSRLIWADHLKHLTTVPSIYKEVHDLGCNFYAKAVVKNPQKVFVDVGLGFFVELTHDEAIAFIEKKTKLLDKKTDKLTQASTKIKANIKLVLHGLRELQGMLV